MHVNGDALLARIDVVQRDADARTAGNHHRLQLVGLLHTGIGVQRGVDDRVVAERIEQHQELLRALHAGARREVPVVAGAPRTRLDRDVVTAAELVGDHRLTADHLDHDPGLRGAQHAGDLHPLL